LGGGGESEGGEPNTGAKQQKRKSKPEDEFDARRGRCRRKELGKSSSGSTCRELKLGVPTTENKTEKIKEKWGKKYEVVSKTFDWTGGELIQL